MTAAENNHVNWLVEQSMLHAARQRARLYSGQGRLWQQPYAQTRPRDATALSSVWFTAYPASIVTREGGTVLEALGDEALWHALSKIGIQGIHNGPLKKSGGLKGTQHTPTIDGNFDRISFEIDPELGTEAQLQALTRMAAAHNAVIIDDVIPSHTGKGADFRLAEMAYEDYPGLYHMVEIREEDWALLPDVVEGRDAQNLSPAQVDALRDKHYIVGQLQRVIFLELHKKEEKENVNRMKQA
jgi:trehalose synthase